MSDKTLLGDGDVAEWLRQRANGHAPGYDIAVYARPHRWLEIANEITSLRAALAEAERERDAAQNLWRCGSKILGENTATLEKVVTDLAAAWETVSKLRSADNMTCVWHIADAFLERTKGKTKC